MRVAAVLVVVLVAAIVFVPLLGRRPADEPPPDSASTESTGEQASAASGSAVLREALLSREMLRDMPGDPDGDGIRAVVFDWGMGNGSATLVAFDDGTTSLYFSGGGGIIGAGAHDAVRRAAA